MKSKIDFKNLSKNLPFKEKVELLFANNNSVTDGGERIISVLEQERLENGICTTPREVEEYNKLIAFYNSFTYIILDLQTAYLNYKSALNSLNTFIIGLDVKLILLRKEENNLEKIYNLLNESLDQEDADRVFKKIEEIFDDKNYLGFDVIKLIDYFSPQGVEPEELEPNNQPNIIFQRKLVNTVKAIKHIQKHLYLIDLIHSNYDINFIKKSDWELVDDYKNEIKKFLENESIITIIDFYNKLNKRGSIMNENLAENDFLDVIADINKSVEITEEEKREMEKILEKYLNRN
ncbi:hypothetical protein C0583_05975 [Candidatus Parcubacteria bacterium]|nr:MAG: hypothetical protein C0583_05975 [Candidatus Parcubacteria bacterium]